MMNTTCRSNFICVEQALRLYKIKDFLNEVRNLTLTLLKLKRGYRHVLSKYFFQTWCSGKNVFNKINQPVYRCQAKIFQ